VYVQIVDEPKKGKLLVFTLAQGGAA